MRTVSAAEAKTKFGTLLARVSRGEEIVITRHDKPVARVVPAGCPGPKVAQRAVDDLRAVQGRIRSRTKGRARLTKAEVRSAIDMGRP
ncbi:MAG: type II toxin-antitoxin system prevent-host-death family antitoxin [Deltaproteobacteria bacterium]|nr:type II toxin-antitoxin system prevent-host-death family antitoxin [Deltaproteobacteria bacterium]